MKLLKPKSNPSVLVFDIETAPLEALIWSPGKQYVTIDQVLKDRSVLSWAAKWLGSPKSDVMYASTAGQRNVRDDKAIMTGLHTLLDMADIVVTQNGKKFDIPIVTGRFLVHGLPRPSPYKVIDTLQLAKKMGFPSNRLAYLTKTLCPELEKLKHNTFPGNELWLQFMAGNKKAHREMEAYNKQDVLGTEGVYKKLAPYGVGVNLDVYRAEGETRCTCGSTNFRRKGYAHTGAGKYQIHLCKDCGSWFRGAENLLSKEHRKSLRRPV